MTVRTLVVGGGIAGLAAALAAADAGAHVTLVVPGDSLGTSGGNTCLAQGGIAAAIGDGDLPSLHAADTVRAGAGLVDPEAAAMLAASGATAVRRLIAMGFGVDREPDGTPTMGLEGAHGRPRIVHAGEDRTGASIHAYLRRAVEARPQAIEVRTGLTVTGLVIDADAVRGAQVRDAAGRISREDADAVVLATGGYAGLYSRSSSTPGATGHGIVIAARAGALLADLEFVQFHPTVFTGSVSEGSALLISEAVRGAGAVLRAADGTRFMPEADPRAELASRDVVSREITRVMRTQASPVWLDATPIEREAAGSLARRFPTITAELRDRGIDWARDPVPVAPAAHYTMGGVATDLDGRSTVPGLFAAGEAAATGVHGANRLASNSLLEGLVFGERAGRAAAQHGSPGLRWEMRGTAMERLRADELVVTVGGAGAGDSTALVTEPAAEPFTQRTDLCADLSAAVDAGLGIIRNAESIQHSARVFAAVAPTHPEAGIAQLASCIVAAADSRTESRGAHYRSDAPRTDESHAARRGVRPVSPRALDTTAPQPMTMTTQETQPC